MLYAGVLAAGDRRPAGHAVRSGTARRPRELHRARPRRDPRLLGRGPDRLDDRALGRSGAARAPRPLVSPGPETLERAERWFDRFGARAAFLGGSRRGPLLHLDSAGVFRTPMPIYLPLTLAGSAIWCFGFAAAGWALGESLGELPSRFPLRRLLGRRHRGARRRLPHRTASARPLQGAIPTAQGGRGISRLGGADPPPWIAPHVRTCHSGPPRRAGAQRPPVCASSRVDPSRSADAGARPVRLPGTVN